jgi:hypothetical protein
LKRRVGQVAGKKGKRAGGSCLEPRSKSLHNISNYQTLAPGII